MNNRLAEETIACKLVADELRKIGENELAHLIDQMAIIREIFSPGRPFKEDATTEAQFNKMKEILDDLNEWKSEIENSNLNEKEKKHRFLPKATYLAWRLILTNVPKICDLYISQVP
jgi:hypothetical protein